MTSGRVLGLAIAGLMILFGAVFTGQGLGWIGGSSMTGDSFWAIAGPIIAGLGVALVIVIVGNARQDKLRQDERYGGRR